MPPSLGKFDRSGQVLFEAMDFANERGASLAWAVVTLALEISPGPVVTLANRAAWPRAACIRTVCLNSSKVAQPRTVTEPSRLPRFSPPLHAPRLPIMGKQQQRTKKDRKAARHNPVRVPDSHLGHGTPAGATHKAKEEAILPIISKVRAAARPQR
jgi:hypothetical protein